MEEHQHNEPFKEEYWEEALGVLEQEERKARRRKIVPIFFSALAAVAIVLVVIKAVLPNEEIKLLTLETFDGPTVERTSTETVQIAIDSALVDSVNSDEASTASTTEERQLTNATFENTSRTADSGSQGEETTPLQSGSPETPTQTTPGDNLTAETPTNEAAPAPKPNSTPQISVPTDEELALVEDGAADNETSILNQGRQAKDPSTILLPQGAKGLTLFANLPVEPRSVGRLEQGLAGTLIRKSFEDKHREFLSTPTMSTPITLYVGNAFAPGYGSRKAGAWNPQAGIALEQRIENRLWLRVAAGAQQISQTFASKSYLEEQASFGYEATETVISTNKLYLLDVPVGLVWDAALRHSVLFGGGVELILRTQNTLEQTKIDAFGTQDLGSEESYGYLTGYDPLMYNLNIGYRYRFSKRNSLDVVASTGFHNVNEVGSSKNGRISVRYNFQIK